MRVVQAMQGWQNAQASPAHPSPCVAMEGQGNTSGGCPPASCLRGPRLGRMLLHKLKHLLLRFCQ